MGTWKELAVNAAKAFCFIIVVTFLGVLVGKWILFLAKVIL